MQNCHFWKTYILNRFHDFGMLSTQAAHYVLEQSYCDIIQSISVCDPRGDGTETAVTCSRFQNNAAPDLSQAKLCLTHFSHFPKLQDITFLRQTMDKVSNEYWGQFLKLYYAIKRNKS